MLVFHEEFGLFLPFSFEDSRCKLDPAFEASFGGCSFPLLRLVVLVNGLGIGFLVVTRILISDLNQLSAECKISLLSGNVFSVCCPDAGVGKGVLDVFGLSGAGFVRFLDRPDLLVLWILVSFWFPVREPSAVPVALDEYFERGSRFEPAPRAVFVVFAYVRGIVVFGLTPRGFRQGFDREDVVVGAFLGHFTSLPFDDRDRMPGLRRLVFSYLFRLLLQFSLGGSV